MGWNYLQSFARLLEKTEVPQRFSVWCGIGSLLAALERRVWINQGIYSIYPNFYFVLIAGSGQKKSTAINTAARLLRRMSPKPNVISQKITPEALIQAIQVTEIVEKKTVLRKKCGGIVIADELATFLDRNALERGLGPILTALYDCTPFEYQTMKRGIDSVEEGFLSILGGTTVELLKSSLPKDAIGGGFTSRTVFIYEDKTPPPVAWIDFDESLIALEQQCVEYLQRVRELEGAVTLTPEAKEFFISNYNDRHKNGEFRKDPMMKQYENRRHAHLLKIAMALMIAEEPLRVIDYNHLYGANIILEEAETHMPRVMELILSSETGLMGNVVHDYIIQKGTVTRAELVRHFSHKMDSQEITKIIDTLTISRRVAIDNIGGKLVYQAIK